MVCTLVAVVCAFLVASSAGRLSWEAAPDLPSGAAETELIEATLPGATVVDSGRSSGLFVEDAEYQPGNVRYLAVAASDPGGLTANAQVSGVSARLEALGWHVERFDRLTVSGPTGDEEKGRVLWASRDGLLVKFAVNADAYPPIELVVTRLRPWFVTPVALAGAAAGALLGWLLAAILVERFRARRSGLRLTACVLAVYCTVIVCPLVSVGVARLLTPDDALMQEPFWSGLMPLLGHGMQPAMWIVPAIIFLIAVLVWPTSRRVRQRE